MGKPKTKTQRARVSPAPPPPPVDFATWRKRFDKSFSTDTPEGRGFNKWKAKIAERFKANLERFAIPKTDSAPVKEFPSPEEAPKIALRRLYSETMPSMRAYARFRKAEESTLKRMEALAKQAESLAEHLKQRDMRMMTQDGFFLLSLKDVFDSCDRAAKSLRSSLTILRREFLHDAKIHTQCMGLILEMEDWGGLTPRECHALIKLSLLAHGYSNDAVDVFNPEQIHAGTIRKAKDALRKRVLESADFVSARVRKK